MGIDPKYSNIIRIHLPILAISEVMKDRKEVRSAVNQGEMKE